MSVINQMLQDLEERRASSEERRELPNQVRVLPDNGGGRLPWRLAAIAGACALIAAFAWRLTGDQPSPALSPAADAPAVATAAKPVDDTQARSSPMSRLSLELESIPAAPVPPAAESVAPVRAAARLAPSQRDPVAAETPKHADDKPAAPIATATVVASAAPANVAAPPRPAKVEPVKSTAAAGDAPAPPVVATKPSGSSLRMVDALAENRAQDPSTKPQIDKRPQALTAQQLAENAYREAAEMLDQGRLADAQEGFRRALQHNPAHDGARQGLYGLLAAAKKYAEAEQVLQEGLRLNPNQLAFAMALSGLQYERGDLGGAVDTLQKSAPAAGNSPDYLARLAALLQRQSRHQEAVERYQAALRLAPGSGVWLMGLGISQQALGRNREAQESFRRARATNTLNPSLQAFVDERLKQLQ